MGGSRRRGSRKTAAEFLYSIRFPLGDPPSAVHTANRSPASHPRTSNPVISTSMSISAEEEYDEVLHVNCESITNFAPTNSPGSINITEFAQKHREEMEIDPEEEEVESAPEPGFVYVNEHRVKMEYAPLVTDLFEKYGDITEGSDVKSPAILSLLLQQLCVIYHKLKETKFFDISLIELEKMLAEVGDLEGLKLNVRWLRKRIEKIISAKIDFGNYLDIKEEERKHEADIKSLENEVSLLQYELCAVQEKLDAKKVKSDETKKVVGGIRARIVDHTTRSLVHGLP